ncbi:MAG: type IV pilus modification protein PilV [Terriglobales bacterium]
MKRKNAGFSLIEILVGLSVLTLGMLGLAALFITAVASNQRSKVDTTATMLAQTVLDAIGSQPISNTSTFDIADCAGNTVTINPVGTSTGAGATTFSDTTYSPAKTQIDWSQAYSATNNYMATYVACNNTTTGTFESPVTYEVRWNITTLSSTTKLVVIAARMKGVSTAQRGTSNLRMFAPPVTLRTIIGNSN